MEHNYNKKPLLAIFTSKEIYHLGESILFKVVLNSDKEVTVRGVYAFLICSQKERVKVFRQMTEDEVEEKIRMHIPVGDRTVVEFKIREIEKIIKKIKIGNEGKYKQKIFLGRFYLQHDYQHTTSSFDLNNKITTWYIDIKLDIPFAPDYHTKKEVIVLP